MYFVRLILSDLCSLNLFYGARSHIHDYQADIPAEIAEKHEESIHFGPEDEILRKAVRYEFVPLELKYSISQQFAYLIDWQKDI